MLPCRLALRFVVISINRAECYHEADVPRIRLPEDGGQENFCQRLLVAENRIPARCASEAVFPEGIVGLGTHTLARRATIYNATCSLKSPQKFRFFCRNDSWRRSLRLHLAAVPRDLAIRQRLLQLVDAGRGDLRSDQ